MSTSVSSYSLSLHKVLSSLGLINLFDLKIKVCSEFIIYLVKNEKDLAYFHLEVQESLLLIINSQFYNLKPIGTALVQFG